MGIVVPAVLMYWSVKKYKETEGEGFLLYGRGFLVGVLFTFVYSSLSGMLVYLHGLLIDASFVDFFIQENLQALGETKDQLIGFLGKEAYAEMIAEFEKFDLVSLALGDFQSKTMAGFILALIIAAILKQKPPVFTDSNDQA